MVNTIKATSLELLAPAFNKDTAVAAINHGADAIYIGADSFGAREKAGNSIQDIEKTVKYAHVFNAKVYATVNTIFFDHEAEQIRKLCHSLWNAGVDAIIIQDTGILELDLPPIRFHISTQADNRTLEKVAFWEKTGVSRVILARELSLKQIAEIRAKTKIELEVFIHGALCVSYSGNCYMSYIASREMPSNCSCGMKRKVHGAQQPRHIQRYIEVASATQRSDSPARAINQRFTERSANRGACSQPCRLPYTLTESDGKVIAEEKHLLSLLDLNVGAALPDLISAGVTSFKIEGRLKDSAYVKNITAFYHALLNNFIEQNHNYYRPAKGNCAISFQPDVERTFSRGGSTYFIFDRPSRLANFVTPKSTGKYAGTVTKTDSKHFLLDKETNFVNGDGICFVSDDRLMGAQIIGKDGKGFIPQDMTGITTGTEIFCNRDTEFIKQIEKSETPRSRNLIIDISETGGILEITADTEGFKSKFTFPVEDEIADNQQRAAEIWKTQISKSGQSAFNVTQVNINTAKLPHCPVSKINELRRMLLDKLTSEILEDAYKNRPVSKINVSGYPEKQIDYQHNVSNRFARLFYEKRNVETIEPAIETDKNKTGKIQVMATRYCILFELGMCLKENKNNKLNLPLHIVGGNHKYAIEFDCKNCEMKISATMH